MKNIKHRVIALVMLLSLLATSTASGISFFYIYNKFKISVESSLKESSGAYAHELNGVVIGIEVAVETFSKSVEGMIDPERINNPTYLESFEVTLEKMAKEFNTNSVKATSFYVRFDPKIAGGTAGIFHADINKDGFLETLPPTDLLKYDPADREHVGWFYEPFISMKPIWMKPYYNANIKTYMVSYIAPLFIDDKAIGVVGIDVDFNRLKNITLDRTGLGQVVLLDQTYNFLVHDTYKMTDQLDTIDGGKLKSLKEKMTIETTGIAHYTLEDTAKVLGFSRLKNGWTVAVAQTQKEAFADFNRTVIVLIGIYMSVVAAMSIVAVIFGRYLSTLLMRNGELEQEVASRTTQLVDTNEYLEETVAELESQQAELLELNNQLEVAYSVQQEMQERLIVSEKLAALGELVAGVAHEINTPIGTTVTLNSFMKKNLEVFKAQYETGQMKKSILESYIEGAFETFEASEKNLSRVIELIERFKEMAAENQLVDIQKVSIRQLIDETLTFYSQELTNKNHHVVILCDPSIEVLTYPMVLKQILRQLIANTMIHGFEALEGRTLQIEVKWIDKNIQMVFSDNGHGIAESDFNKVFNPFYTTRKNKGSVGLGLHRVYNLVTQTLKGTIELRHSVDGETLFLITFPELLL